MKLLALSPLLIWLAPANALYGDVEEDPVSRRNLKLIGKKKQKPDSSARIASALPGICNNFVDSVTLVPGTDCFCEPTIRPPTITVGCATIDPVCIIPPTVLCGIPSVAVGIDVFNLLKGGLPVVFEVCFTEVTIAGIPVPELAFIPFCIKTGGGIIGLITGIIGGNAKSLGLNTSNMKVGDSEACTARFGNTDCNSCTVCDAATGGVLFDCSNIAPKLVSTKCAPLPPYFPKA